MVQSMDIAPYGASQGWRNPSTAHPMDRTPCGAIHGSRNKAMDDATHGATPHPTDPTGLPAAGGRRPPRQTATCHAPTRG
eukprot:1628003-Pyramimonas_sp.AAC.1